MKTSPTIMAVWVFLLGATIGHGPLHVCGQESRDPGQFPREVAIRVEFTGSKYRVASGRVSGIFRTGQDADLMLSGIDFNNTGGPLLFNHPSGLASDGRSLLVCDRNNNRVLVWRDAPARNTPPDLVVGQPNFTTNDPGQGRNQLNWPGNVTITPDGKTIALADTNNDRVLIWNSFPAANGSPADVVLGLAVIGQAASEPQGSPLTPGSFRPERGQVEMPRPGGGQRLGWPWGVWTDGKKFAVVCTHGRSVLVWNSVPSTDNRRPDLMIRPESAGTLRNITSDGEFFAVSDHNYGEDSRPATMVWRTFPTDATRPPDFVWREWLKGTLTPDRKLLLGGMTRLYLWNVPPRDTQTDADVVLRPPSYRNGDGPDVVFAAGRFYACNYNGNNVLVWNELPTRDDQPPDFAIGSDSPDRDTLKENFFVTNPVVATDGTSLYVSSDFDRRLLVWRQIPDESGAKPDVVYSLPEGPWDNALHGQTLVLAGRRTVYVWKRLPLDGERPDIQFSGGIGSVQFRGLTGVALDDRYLYVADRDADRIYVWDAIPGFDDEPRFTLDVPRPGRLSSDGKYLAVAPFEGSFVSLYRVGDLQSRATAMRLGGPGRFNLPGKCVVSHGHLFVADTSFNRVQVWHDIEDAIDGRPADALLGADGPQDTNPEIGRNKLFMPGTIAFDGSYLWVGEFKFSGRLLRFSPHSQAPNTEPRLSRGSKVSEGQAPGRGPVKLKNFPLHLEDISSICPMGLMVGGHVTPSDHLGVAPKDPNAAVNRYDVLAMADGFVVEVQRAPRGNPDPAVPQKFRDMKMYKVTMQHTDTFWTYIGLINTLEPFILAGAGGEIPAGPPLRFRVPVKAGQVIGKFGGGHGIDFGVINTAVTLQGFIVPERFRGRDPLKLHTVDPFEYVDEPLKGQLLALTPRKAAPRGGKIDYDIDGRLVGNWYKQGTGGYAGFRGQLDYWLGHLSIVYHHIDSTQITVSIGDFGGQVRQFWVKGNLPDPAEVSVDTGPVKYELVYARIGSAGQTFEGIPTGVQGVLLVEMQDDRRLKVQSFPGKTASQVHGFTAEASVYER